MKNDGPARCVLDISQGQSRAVTRERWKAGDYGGEGMRPKPEHVDGWLRSFGR